MACASAFAYTSPLFQNKLKLTSWISSRKQRHGMHILKTSFRKSDQIIHDFYNSKCELMTRRWVSYATSEVPLSLTELTGEKCEPDNDSNRVAEDCASINISSNSLERNLGKPGFISFQGIPFRRVDDQVLESSSGKEISKLLWFIGPIALVTFLVFPSLYLRRILSTMCEDSLLTDFLILFFTESLFYGGVAIFLYIADHIWRPLLQNEPRNKVYLNFKYGIKVPSVATLVLTLIIPLVTMGMVWPWTGPAASATLAPYLVGLFVQFAFERYARFIKSPSWPVIPIIFQVYRLHQLNRAAQLVTALSFSLRGAETTSQTLAINSSLGTLLTVLQILGVICIWSLSSFLMRIIPPAQVIP